jgi:hypothetical protein
LVDAVVASNHRSPVAAIGVGVLRSVRRPLIVYSGWKEGPVTRKKYEKPEIRRYGDIRKLTQWFGIKDSGEADSLLGRIIPIAPGWGPASH